MELVAYSKVWLVCVDRRDVFVKKRFRVDVFTSDVYLLFVSIRSFVVWQLYFTVYLMCIDIVVNC